MSPANAQNGMKADVERFPSALSTQESIISLRGASIGRCTEFFSCSAEERARAQLQNVVVCHKERVFKIQFNTRKCFGCHCTHTLVLAE